MRAILNQDNILDKVLQGILFTVAFTIPFSFSINSISIGILFMLSFYWFKKETLISIKSEFPEFIIFFLIYFIIIVSLFYTSNLDSGLNTVYRSVAFLLFPITFFNLKEKINNKDLKAAFVGLLISLLIILFTTHFRIINEIVENNLHWKAFFFYYIRGNFIEHSLVQIHAPYYGLLVLFSIIISFKLTMFRNLRLNKLARFFIISYLIISLYQISSLMSILIVILFLITRIYFLRNNKSRVLTLLLGILLSVVMVSLVYNNDLSKYNKGNETVFNRIESAIRSGDQVRMQNWESVIRVISDHWLVGVGSDGGLKLLQHYRDNSSEPFVNKHNAHNQYLEFFLRYGIIGFSLFILLILKIYLKAFRSSNYYFKWFILIFSISCLTESLLQRQIGIVFFTFYAALFVVFVRKHNLNSAVNI